MKKFIFMVCYVFTFISVKAQTQKSMVDLYQIHSVLYSNLIKSLPNNTNVNVTKSTWHQNQTSCVSKKSYIPVSMPYYLPTYIPTTIYNSSYNSPYIFPYTIPYFTIIR